MSNHLRTIAILTISACAAGCGDGPQPIVHDCVVFWNEVCDNMVRAKDDETAKKLMDAQFRVLEKRYEHLKERAEKAFRDIDKDEAKELENALVDYYDEIVATEKRLDHCMKRLAALIKSSSPNDNLKRMETWLNDPKRKDLDRVGLGSGGVFTPALWDDPLKPKQFGVGLVPARPQFKRTDKK